MNPDTFNLELRRFLKTFGVTAQRDLEQSVAAALEARKIAADRPLQARATLEVEGLGRVTLVEGGIGLG